MELDNMKKMWQEMNLQLAQQRQLNEQLISRLTKGASRKNLSAISSAESVNLILNILLLVVFVAQMPRVGDIPSIIACYVFNLLIGSLAVWISLLNLRHLRSIDPGNTPVSELLYKVNKFRLFVARQRTWGIILGPVMILTFYAVVTWWIKSVNIFEHISRYIPVLIIALAAYSVLVLIIYNSVYFKNIKEIKRSLEEIEDFRN